MGLFDNLKVVTEGIAKSVNEAQSAIAAENKELTKIKERKNELQVIESEVNIGYTEIGKKFVQHVIESGEMPGIDVSEVLTSLEAKLEREIELKEEILEIERKLNEMRVLKEKDREVKKYEAEKEKLDKALALNIINKEEYDEKIRTSKNRVEYFTDIKNVNKQFEMGIINFEEKEFKIREILNR
ncbi:MAG: hypothetical protein ACRC28_10930 [Clostridium sp.]|uniref:hypothetical protein n=1 Tax=Clostridium sp. TaxID=1506 RepID=UPI003F36B3CB